MCNCKKGVRPKRLNNLTSTDHLKLAEDVNNRIITQKSFEEIDDFDWAELYSVFSQLYPHSSVVPPKETVITEIQNAVGLLGIKYTTKKRR